MAESKPDPTQSVPDVEAKEINTVEKIETDLHTDRGLDHHGETHGLRNDIDENTPLTDVKAPNVFERVKEEIEALVETIHHKEESQAIGKRDQSTKEELKAEKLDSLSEAKSPNLIERAKEEIEAIIHHEKSPPHHHKETHGRSDDIDESTHINEVKAPNVFERVKEEVEALVGTIHPKKQSSKSFSSSEKKRGFMSSIGRMLEKACSPGGTKRD